MNDGDRTDAGKEHAMQSQPTSFILLAEVRHAELQAEAAHERLAMQARGDRFPPMRFVTPIRHLLGIRFAGGDTLLHDWSNLAITSKKLLANASGRGQSVPLPDLHLAPALRSAAGGCPAMTHSPADRTGSHGE
jgi:hypothetical protein